MLIFYDLIANYLIVGVQFYLKRFIFMRKKEKKIQFPTSLTF